LQETINKYITKKPNNYNKFVRNMASSYVEQRKEGGISFSAINSFSTNGTMDSNKSMVFQPKEGLNINVEESGVFEFSNINENEDDFSELLNNFNIDYNFNQEVSELFFNFNANLLSNYNQYLNRDFYSLNTSPCLEILFKVPEYLKTIPAVDKNFYDKFITETQIFGDFIYLRMIPKNSKEKIRILRFDEKINENSNASKNNSGVFTNTKEYEFVNNHAIQGPRELTEKEIDFYKNKNNQKLLLTYGVIARENKIEIVENKPLARMLYANVDIDAEVPPELYQAVAEVLAYVYHLQGR
jgi:hypothetical protein